MPLKRKIDLIFKTFTETKYMNNFPQWSLIETNVQSCQQAVASTETFARQVIVDLPQTARSCQRHYNFSYHSLELFLMV